MKKIFLAAIVLCSFCESNGQSIPKWKITDVEDYIAHGKGDILVLNFWATFCKPCVAEIPAFVEIAEKYRHRNVKLLLVSLDLPSSYPKKIAEFTKQHHFKTNIAWMDESNADYFCPKIDPKWSGSIPATLIINTKTGYRQFFEEEIDAKIFEKALINAIQSSPVKKM